jgi:hypothetical protein
MTKHLSTLAKRKSMARAVSALATRVMGIPVALEPCPHYPLEFQFRKEDFETDGGQVHHCVIDVCPRGVNVHIRFPRAFGHKWNHYLWPSTDQGATEYREQVLAQLARILKRTIPNGSTRQDRPDMGDYWASERALFAAGKTSAIYGEPVKTHQGANA